MKANAPLRYSNGKRPFSKHRSTSDQDGDKDKTWESPNMIGVESRPCSEICLPTSEQDQIVGKHEYLRNDTSLRSSEEAISLQDGVEDAGEVLKLAKYGSDYSENHNRSTVTAYTAQDQPLEHEEESSNGSLNPPLQAARLPRQEPVSRDEVSAESERPPADRYGSPLENLVGEGSDHEFSDQPDSGAEDSEYNQEDSEFEPMSRARRKRPLQMRQP